MSMVRGGGGSTLLVSFAAISFASVRMLCTLVGMLDYVSRENVLLYTQDVDLCSLKSMELERRSRTGGDLQSVKEGTAPTSWSFKRQEPSITTAGTSICHGLAVVAAASVRSGVRVPRSLSFCRREHVEFFFAFRLVPKTRNETASTCAQPSVCSCLAKTDLDNIFLRDQRVVSSKSCVVP